MNEIIGAGGGGKGGGGGGRAAIEAPNTLRSSAVARVVEVISEGEIEGICGGAKGVYLNDTPLQASDGTYNFPRALWDYRVGLPSQDYMKGFSAVQSEVVVNSAVQKYTDYPTNSISGAITRTTSAANIDAVNVAIQLPNGLYSQDTSTGDLNGSKVEFVIEKKLTSSGAWTGAQSFTIDGKTTSAYERQYRIDRPAGTGTWDIRVSRTTADSQVASVRNGITWARLTEIQEIKDATTDYNNTAVIGLAIDAETVGNQVPVRSYLVKGVKIQVPSNYNPTTRVYTGIWDGTFQTAWTDNPAWVLYDLLTNSRYGLGEFITASQVDKYSFYDAAVYNDAGIVYNTSGVYVSGGIPDGEGGYEPRFTFNAVIGERVEALKLLQNVAGAMRGTLVYFNGQVTLLQDRPTAVSKIITKANVIDGLFNYKSSGLFERHTAVNVTYNDRNDRHLQRVATVDASTTTGAMQSALAAAESKYGYNSVDIAAFGAVTASQAKRQARWLLDTEINQTEVGMWKMSISGFDLFPGDVVKVFDEDYAATVGAGKVVSVVGSTVTVDRAITLSSGSTIDVLLADGVTIETRNIVETSGTVTSFTVSVGFSQSVLTGADYIVTTAVSARQFKIIGIRQEEANIISVEAISYDPNKFDRVETGLVLAAPIFSNAIRTTTSVPTALTFKEYSVTIDSTIRRSLLISWGAPATGAAASYTISYRCNGATWVTVANHASLAYELVNVNAGVYDVKVFSVSAYGAQSAAVTGSYTLTTAANGVSDLYPVTSLVDVDTGNSTFNGVDLNFSWHNPTTNSGVLTTGLRDFEIIVKNPTTDAVVRTYYEPAVAAGATQKSSYTYAMNLADNGGSPLRSLIISVRCRDVNGNYSTPVAVTFTNAAPAMPTNVTLNGGFGSVFSNWDASIDTDYAGTIVWMSTLSTFVPDASNVVFDGRANFFNKTGLSDGTTYYIKVAHYDTFYKSYSGTGLNLTGYVSSSTESALPPGVPSGTTLPSGDNDSHLFYKTDEGKLYRYVGSAWTKAVDGGDITANTVTTNQIATGTIVAANIAAGTITGAKIAANTIVGSNIAANTIDAGKLNVTSLSAIQADLGTITAGTMYGTSYTNYLDLNATGSNLFLKIGTYPQRAYFYANGNAYFDGVVISRQNVIASGLAGGTGSTPMTTETGVAGSFTVSYGFFGSGPTVDQASYTFLIDTGYDDYNTIGNVNSPAMVGNAIVSHAYFYWGADPGSIKVYDMQCQVDVVRSIAHYKTGASSAIPLGRVYLRVTVLAPKNIPSGYGISQIDVTGIDWALLKVT